MDKYETHETEVLVIGAGGAGLRAAIESSAQGCKTALVCKSLLGKAHTVMAEGGIAAALANVDAEDDWRVHFHDTMSGGKMLNNWRMAELHAKEAPERVYELERWGAVFDRTPDGRILQRAFGGHRHKRLSHVGDRTGLEMIRTLQDKGIHQGIDVYMECTITRLLTDRSGRVVGAFGYWRESGRYVVFKSKSAILATGGIGKSYQVTSNSWEYTGDGHAMAYEAGASLIDMEFVQFHPTGMVWPPGVRGLLVTEAVRGEGGLLRNAKGERFMFKYLPESTKKDFADTEQEAKAWVDAVLSGRKPDVRRPPELSTRDNVARSIYTEVKEGRGSPHGGVFLDISYQPAERVKQKLPSMYHQFLELADVDITKEPMEVGPTAHYIMGGVRVDPDSCASTVAGLFAAGEVTGGMHGSNRLGGNSLSDLLVFGRRAGMGAADHAKRASAPIVSAEDVERAAAEASVPFERAKGENPYDIQRDLQETMSSMVGIFRTETDLQEGVRRIDRLKERASRVSVEGSRLYNPGWHLALDLRNLLLVSEAIAKAALARRESRGGHSRLDYPNADSRQGKVNIDVSKKGPDMHIRETPLPEMPAALRSVYDEVENMKMAKVPG